MSQALRSKLISLNKQEIKYQMANTVQGVVDKGRGNDEFAHEDHCGRERMDRGCQGGSRERNDGISASNSVEA